MCPDVTKPRFLEVLMTSELIQLPQVCLAAVCRCVGVSSLFAASSVEAS